MVENYYLQRCKYLLGSLKPFIYVLPKETTRISYIVENYPVETNGTTAYVGKCEVNGITATEIVKIEGFKTMLNVSEGVNNRLQFATKVTLSLREYWGETWVSLLGRLKRMNCYVVVEDKMGVQYIQSPEFISAFGYSYLFNTEGGNESEITYTCDSNNPLVILKNNITPTETISIDCEYDYYDVRNFKMCPYNYAFIDNDVETGEFTTITCTGGEAMHLVEFLPRTFQFRQQYDGTKYQERLVFKIPLSDYKYYFRYNLVAFMQNRYAITFETVENNWIAAGFEFGFEPTYTVETSETVAELNTIEITLQHSGQNSIFYCPEEPTIVESTTDVYVPVTNEIKDPITGLELRSWHCISKTEAIYTLVQMVTESGVVTDRYMYLNDEQYGNYAEYYSHLNLVGSYTSTSNLGFELIFSNSNCAIKDNCEFEKMTKEVYRFSRAGDYYDVHILNPCPWELVNIPNWIEASRLSGNGGIDYVVRFTSKEDATEQRKISYSYIKSFDNIGQIQLILEMGTDWISPIEHHIDARAQSVTSYIDLDFNSYEICEIPTGLRAEKMRSNSTVRISVPENPSESEERMFTVKICDTRNGRIGYIYIYQDHLYSRWAYEGSYICEQGNSYKKIVKYIGYDADHINIMTDIYTTGELLIEEDPRCEFDDDESDKYLSEWRDVDGTICIGTHKWTKQQKWESHNNGVSWVATEEYREKDDLGESVDCQDLPTKKYKRIIDEDLYDCVNYSSFYYECLWWSYDEIEWYKVDPSDCIVSTTMKKENDPACGGGGVEPGYNEKWVRSDKTVCKNGYLYLLDRKYTSTDGGLTWVATNEYRETNISTGEDCSETELPIDTWICGTGDYVCYNGNSYYLETKYYYFPSEPNVLIQYNPIQSRRGENCLRMENDPSCSVTTRIYRWNTNTGETICQGEDLYERQDYQYSDDNGLTWQNVDPPVYRTGELIEASSSECTVTPQTKWVIDRTRWQCEGTTSYYYEVQYESTDGINWIKSVPEVSRYSPRTETLRLENDPDCGSGETIYRWVDDGDNYLCEYETEPIEDTRWIALPRSSWVCEEWNLYSVEKEQRLVDGEWQDTGRTRTGAAYEENATECTQKTNCVFRNGAAGFTFDCEGNRTTTAQGIYLDYRIRYLERTTSYDPYIRLVTSSPQGNNWYSVTRTSHTVEGTTIPTYLITIASNSDEGRIDCYWEIYNRANNEILHTTDTFRITRNRHTS